MKGLSSKYLFGFLTLIMLLPVSAISQGGQADDIPPAARMVIHKAQKHMEKKQFAEAIDALEKFRKKGKTLNSDTPDSKGYRHYLVHFTLGNCYLMNRNYSAAEARYRAAVTLNPGFHQGWMNLAKCCYDMEAHAKAGHAFLKGHETAPKKDPETLYFGAVCFMSGGDSKKALDIFHRLLKEYPQSEIELEWKEALVQAYFDCDQPREALPFIETLSEQTKGEKRRQWQEVRLHTYLSLNMKKKALRYVNHLIREYPTEARWWKGLAHLYLKENRYKPALAALSIKGFLEPLTPQEEKIVADLNMTLGIPIEAVRSYEKLAEGKSKRDAAYGAAQGYLRLHQPEKALKWVEKALAGQKNNPRLLLLKGELLYALERYPEATVAFETAAREKTSAGRAWLMAGYAAWNAKEMRTTRRAFENAAKYSGQKKAALKALRQLDREAVSIVKGGG